MDRYITLVKALGIFTIVNGHLNAGDLGHIYYLFHIPLFFFLTGYLYKEKYTENPLQMLRQRLKTIYAPFVLYGFLFLLLRDFFLKTGLYSIDAAAKDRIAEISNVNQYLETIKYILTFQYYEPLLLTFWFLVVLFEVSIIFALIRLSSEKFFGNNPKEATFFIVTILFLIGFRLFKAGIVLPLQLDKALITLIFVNLGYIYKCYKEKILLKTSYALLGMLALIVFVKFGYVNIDLRKYTDPPYFILSALLGIYIVFWLANVLSKYTNSFTHIIEIIGNNTLSIMTLHIFAFKIVTYIRVKLQLIDPILLSNTFPPVQGIPIKIIYIIAGIALPVVFGLLFKKIWGLLTTKKLSLTPSLMDQNK